MFEACLAVGVVLVVLGVTSLIGVRLNGMPERGKYRTRALHASTYVRVGPVLVVVGVLGVWLLH